MLIWLKVCNLTIKELEDQMKSQDQSKPVKGLLLMDIDGTHNRWSLFLHSINLLVEFGMLNKATKLAFDKLGWGWKNRDGTDYKEYLNAAIKMYAQRFVGLNVKDFELIADELIKRYGDEVYLFTRDLVKAKQKQGWHVVFVSASQEELVSRYARKWGVTEWHATIAQTKDGVFTGKRRLMVDKSTHVKKILARPEFAHIPRKNIWMAADTESDISMLEQAGLAICFNPDHGLRCWAEANSKQIVVERKSEIYCIPKNRQLLPYLKVS